MEFAPKSIVYNKKPVVIELIISIGFLMLIVYFRSYAPVNHILPFFILIFGIKIIKETYFEYISILFDGEYFVFKNILGISKTFHIGELKLLELPTVGSSVVMKFESGSVEVGVPSGKELHKLKLFLKDILIEYRKTNSQAKQILCRSVFGKNEYL